MTDLGEGGLSEPARKRLDDDYPGWRVFRNGSLVQARRLNTSPPPVLRATSVGRLRAQIEVFEAVLARTRDLGRAEEAARVLEN